MRVYKSEKTVHVPKDLNLTQLLHQCAPDRQIPDSQLICKDNLTNRSITIGELRDRAGRLARGLKEKYDIRDGDRFALILPNCVEFLEIYHTVLWTGGVVCPINHQLKPAEIGHALVISKPKYVFTYTPVLRNVEEAIKIAAEDLQKKASISHFSPSVITVINNKSASHAHFPDDFLSRNSLPIPQYAEETTTRVATIHLSSGTTGLPKGVQLTHHNYVANCYQMYAHDPHTWSQDTRIVSYTPFVHIAMTTQPLFLGPWMGFLTHAMPAFSLDDLGAVVQGTRATNIQGVAAVIKALAETDITERYDFSSVDTIQIGGAPFTPELLEKLYRKGKWGMSFLYGMTEAAPYVSWQKRGEVVPWGAVGKLLPGMEGVLRKEGTVEDAKEGGPGEFWIRGPNLAKGYVSIESDTVRPLADDDGWYNTGDVCTIDSQGFLSVVGRTKELIKYKGFQVSPMELEALLAEHPLVADAAVGALWDEDQLTELPTGYVVLANSEKGWASKEDALRKVQRDVDDRVSGYKKLRGGVWQVRELPRNAQTKILRRELKATRIGPNSLGRALEKAKL